MHEIQVMSASELHQQLRTMRAGADDNWAIRAPPGDFVAGARPGSDGRQDKRWPALCYLPTEG